MDNLFEIVAYLSKNFINYVEKQKEAIARLCIKNTLIHPGDELYEFTIPLEGDRFFWLLRGMV